MGDYFKRGYDSVLEGIPRQIMDSVGECDLGLTKELS